MVPVTEDDMNANNTPVRRRRLLDAGLHQDQLDAYGQHLSGTGLSPVSVHIHLGSARHFLAWLEQDGITLDEIGPDIAARFVAHACRCQSSPRAVGQARRIHAIPMKRSVQPLVGYLTRAEMQALLAAPDARTAPGLRDQAMLHLAFAAGLRVPELVGLRLDQFADAALPMRIDAPRVDAILHQISFPISSAVSTLPVETTFSSTTSPGVDITP